MSTTYNVPAAVERMCHDLLRDQSIDRLISVLQACADNPDCQHNWIADDYADGRTECYCSRCSAKKWE